MAKPCEFYALGQSPSEEMPTDGYCQCTGASCHMPNSYCKKAESARFSIEQERKGVLSEFYQERDAILNRKNI